MYVNNRYAVYILILPEEIKIERALICYSLVILRCAVTCIGKVQTQYVITLTFNTQSITRVLTGLEVLP